MSKPFGALSPVPTAVPPSASSVEGLNGQQQQLRVALKARSPAGDLLRERDGRCVLQVGAPGLRRRLSFSASRRWNVAISVSIAGMSLSSIATDGRDVHSRREGVVGRLATC